VSEWQECTLGEFVESVSETYKFKSKEQVVFLNTSDILFGKVTNRLHQDSSNLPGQAKKRIKKGDFLFSEIRPANGRYAVIDFNAENYVVSTKLMVLRCNNGINRDYFRIFLTSKEQLYYLQLLAEDRSGTFPQITFDHISNLNISLPPLPEQKAIASVLSSLDDKIDLLHRQNKTLEAMAETLFRQWFVEEAQEDWKEVSITELFEVRDGTHDSPKQSVVGRPLITSKHILDGQLDIANAYLISENDFNKINQRSKVDTGDILFSMIGTIGLIYFEQSSLIDYAIKNIGLFKTSQNSDWAIFTFLWLKSPIGRQFIDKHKSGSTQEYVALGSMRSIVFQKPPIEILKKFNKLASSYFAKIKLLLRNILFMILCVFYTHTEQVLTCKKIHG
jgi:type I restriction enzyme S subunit